MSKELNLSKEYHVVANIPYNITSPIIFKILEEEKIASATLMVQKEVCDRITAKKGIKAYNALSVIIQYYMDVEKIMNVSKKLFHLIPKVDSAVFRMRRKKVLFDKDKTSLFIKIVKSAFHQKRKTLINNLNHSMEIEKSDLGLYLDSINIDKNLRAEMISVNDFMKIVENWPF